MPVFLIMCNSAFTYWGMVSIIHDLHPGVVLLQACNRKESLRAIRQEMVSLMILEQKGNGLDQWMIRKARTLQPDIKIITLLKGTRTGPHHCFAQTDQIDYWISKSAPIEQIYKALQQVTLNVEV